MSPRARVSWLAAYGLVTFLSFPQSLGGGVLDLGIVLAWLSPACLLLGLEGLGVARAARLGFIGVWLAHAAILHWIFVVTVVYGGAPAIVGALAPFALASYVGLHGALFGGAYAWLARRGAASPLAIALLWVSLDHLRSFLLTGFPWAEIGYAQHANALLRPLAGWTGVYGLSFVTALGGAVVADRISAWRRGGRPAFRGLGIVLGIVVLHGLGAMGLYLEEDGSATTLRVAAIQGNIDQREKWGPERFAETIDLYERLSREAVADGARLVVWPETAIPGPVELDRALADRLIALARETRAAYVIGAVGVRVDAEANEITDYYDSAFVLDWQGRVVGRYDKSKRVPFGEYVPLRGLLGNLISALAPGIAPMDVSPGDEPRAIEVDLGPGIGRIRLGTPICYELLFPERVRGFVEDGAQLLVAITNDAWYGRTGAPHQFLAITALRSAETGAWTVRAANTGVSAIIDRRGKVRTATAVFEPAVLVAEVPLLAEHGQARRTSPYVGLGDAFALACWLGLAFVVARAMRNERPAAELDGSLE